MDGADQLFAVVAYEGSRQGPAQVFSMFESPVAADGFAVARNFADYVVAPVGFVIEETPAGRPEGPGRMRGMGDAMTAAEFRVYALAVLEQDAAYDRDPQGDPVLWTADMRRGLSAALRVEPTPVLTADCGVTDSEVAAHLAGQRAALDVVHTAIAQAFGRDRLRGDPIDR